MSRVGAGSCSASSSLQCLLTDVEVVKGRRVFKSARRQAAFPFVWVLSFVHILTCVFLQEKYSKQKEAARPHFLPEQRPKCSLPPPPIGNGLLIDASANLLSRQFDNDLIAVMRRTKESNVSAVVLSCLDFTRADDVVALAKQVCVCFQALVGLDMS